MKNLIFWAVVGVVGYFAYQYLVGPWLADRGSSGQRASEYVVFIPDECQAESESLKDAFNRREMGEIGKVSVNGFTQNFRRCLKRAGLTADEIDEAYESIKNSR